MRLWRWMACGAVAMACVAGRGEDAPRNYYETNKATRVYGDVTITPVRAVGEASSYRSASRWRHGYGAYYAVVTNASPSAWHDVGISYGGERGSSYYGRPIAYERSARIAPQEIRLVSLPLFPAAHGWDSRWTVTLDGRVSTNTLWDGNSHYFNTYDYLPRRDKDYSIETRVLLSPRLSEIAVRYRREELFKKAGRSGDGSVNYFTGVFDVREWETAWQAYAEYDAIIVQDADWEAMPQGVQMALGYFALAGGELIFAGEGITDIPEGITDIPVCDNEFIDTDRNVCDTLGFGRVSRIAEAAPEAWTLEDVDMVSNRVHSAMMRWAKTLTTVRNYETERRFTPPPMIAVLIILLALSLFLGPVLLIVLARMNRRICIYWIAPVVACVTGACVVAYAFHRDGVSPILYAQTAVWLDQESRTAVALCTATVMAPISISEPLRFERDTEVTPAPSGAKSFSGTRRVVWGEEQILSPSWLPPRTPVTFLLRKVAADVPRALDLSTGEDGTVAAVNRLGGAIERLLVCDAAGNYYGAGETVPEGATATLHPFEDASTRTPLSAQDFYALFSDEPETLAKATERAFTPPFALPPGAYVAVVGGNPFIERFIGVPARATEATLVFGRLQ
ncbi:MAG: hypothetical protein FWF84_07175 [Kiritimatiellaeota bacterium]|nr:hypothetical protein [Kiritimatiellota bacterium]